MSTIIFMFFENFLKVVIFCIFLLIKKNCFQVFLESKPQNNPYRIKVKPTPTDQALLTTLQTVPGLGQRKAMALLAKFNSKKMNIIILITFILRRVSGLEKTWIAACPLGKQLSHFAYLGQLLVLLRAQLASWTIAWPVSLKMKINRLLPRVFAEKLSPSCILFRIWLIWLESFD